MAHHVQKHDRTRSEDWKSLNWADFSSIRRLFTFSYICNRRKYLLLRLPHTHCVFRGMYRRPNSEQIKNEFQMYFFKSDNIV